MISNHIKTGGDTELEGPFKLEHKRVHVICYLGIVVVAYIRPLLVELAWLTKALPALAMTSH